MSNGFKRTKEHQDWFDESDAAITKLLEEQSRLHKRFLAADDFSRKAAEKPSRTLNQGYNVKFGN